MNVPILYLPDNFSLPGSSALRKHTFLVFLVQKERGESLEAGAEGVLWAEYLWVTASKYRGNELGERVKRDLIYNSGSSSFPQCLTQTSKGCELF